MSGPVAVRLAGLVAAGYGLWVLVGGPVRFGGSADALTMRLSFTQPIAWLVGLVAVVLGVALWMRQAWAWWLGLAAALVQAGRILYPMVAQGTLRLPSAATLLVLALITAFLVLLLLPKARASCDR